MQALEKIAINNYWFTILLVCLLLSVFFLKMMNAKKLKTSALALFLRGVLEEENEDAITIVTPFKTVVFLFSVTVLTCVIYKLSFLLTLDLDEGGYRFLFFFLIILSYFVLKRLLEYLLSVLFLIKKEIKFFLVAKSSYLYSVCFLLYVGVILTEYSILNTVFLLYLAVLLFVIRFVLHIISNKKLVFNKLFYFFLYLCAFEIAPLFILFKLMF